MSKLNRYLPALLLIAGVAASTTACAAQVYGSGYPRGGGGYARDLERRAYDNGFREGAEHGQGDARNNRDFSPQRHDEYRDADHGYNRRDGDRELYRRSYRQGFQAGYRESYTRNGRDGRDNRYGRDDRDGRDERYGRDGRDERDDRYGRDDRDGRDERDERVVIAPNYPDANRGYGSYGSMAAQNGYRDGLEAGRDDARGGDRFDPVRAKRYREGDHDYNDRDGSRDDYKRDYRSVFQQGYREGYGRRY